MKTRSLASETVKAGRVQVNRQRAKPSKEVGAGDRLEITIGQARLTVVVVGVAERRGPAKETQRLYEETAESIAEREHQADQRRLTQAPQPDHGGRPTKRDRRRFDRTPGARRGRR